MARLDPLRNQVVIGTLSGRRPGPVGVIQRSFESGPDVEFVTNEVARSAAVADLLQDLLA
jgi:hypothetical protein